MTLNPRRTLERVDLPARSRRSLDPVRLPAGVRRVLDRVRLPAGVRRAVEQIGLPAWFVVIDLLWIANPAALAIDARHYQRAATTWLAGGDPWAVIESGIPFASAPHTLAWYAPTSLLPLEASVALWMAAGLLAAWWTIRRLGLPGWWLLFPPLAHGVWNGNPQTVALALVLAGGPAAAALAVTLKLYVGLVLARRPRDLVVAGVVVLLVLPLLPWQLYLEGGLGVGSHLQTAWNGSAWRIPLLVPLVLLALWVLRRQGAEWYAVPAVFPATQFYYVALALPAVARRPVLAAALAFPMVLMTPIVVVVLAVGVVRDTGWGAFRPGVPKPPSRRPAPSA